MKLITMLLISATFLATGVEAVVAPTLSPVAVAASKADAPTQSPENCKKLDKKKLFTACKSIRKVCKKNKPTKCAKRCKKKTKNSKQDLSACKEACCPPPPPPPKPPPPPP